jgi:flagellar hook-associated protein 3 FlgL
MRIATGYAQKSALDGITDRQAALIKSQEQLSSGKRVNRPSDDPAAAAEAEKVRSRQARMDAEKRAVGYAQQQLSNADNTIGDATSLLQNARETLLRGANATNNTSDRFTLGANLSAIRDQLLAVANRSDGTGGFVFGGQGANSAPIAADGTTYNAQPGTVQVGQDLSSPVSLDGRANFTASPTATGTESIFAQLDAAIAVFKDPTATAASAAAIAQSTLGGVDRSIDRLGVTRATVGERLNAIDTHLKDIENGTIDNASRISALVDVDFAAAISNMAQNQTTVEAALKSYSTISKMSLFNFL